MLRRMFAALALLGCGGCALAGYYAVAYSTSGTTRVQWTTGGVDVTIPYAQPNFGGGGVAPDGSVTDGGSMTATMTWVADPSLPDDEPPAFVVVAEYGSATWSGDGGSCSDGLGDPEQDFYGNPSAGPNQGQSTGTRYRIVANPGSGFTLSENPAADGYGSGSPLLAKENDPGRAFQVGIGAWTPKATAARPRLAAAAPPLSVLLQAGGGGSLYPTGRISAYVSYTVETWTPELLLSNLTIGSDGSWNIQAGIPTTASVYWFDETGLRLPGLPPQWDSSTYYAWGIHGTTFVSWDTSLDSATYTPFSPTEDASQSFVWCDAGSNGEPGPAQTIVEVLPQIVVGGQNIGGADLTIRVEVYRPYFIYVGAAMRTPDYLDGLPNPYLVTSQDNDINFSVGVDGVFGQTPAGSVNFCQVVNLDDVKSGFGWYKEDTTSGQYVLDTNGESTNWYWKTDGQGNPSNLPCALNQEWPKPPKYLDGFWDFPGWDLTWLDIEASRWSVSYSFVNWTMYRPTGGVWIPLTVQHWSWVDGQVAPYVDPPLPGPVMGFEDLDESFPLWDGYHDAH